MSDWRDNVGEERPAFGLGDLGEGDEIVGTFLDDGKTKDTRHGDALVLGIAVQEAPDGYETMNDNPLSEGEDYNLMSSSSRLKYELAEYADDLKGATVSITAEGENFDRTYTVENA